MENLQSSSADAHLTAKKEAERRKRQRQSKSAEIF